MNRMCPLPHRAAFLALGLFLFGIRLCGQGGPPMLTDDPGTPGPNKWELNFGWTTQLSPGTDLTALPEIDLNYGIGERVEITYFADYYALRTDGEGTRWGLSDSELAVKWRFLDTGDGGVQMSVYPQVNFLTPGSHSDRRGIAEGATTYQLPVEFEKDFKQLSVDVDLGRLFASGGEPGGWFGGVCLTHQLAKGWDIDGEVHLETDASTSRSESILNLATRIDLAENYTLMLLVGRDLSNDFAPKATFLSYVGLQIRL
jgi:hypothetical protein